MATVHVSFIFWLIIVNESVKLLSSSKKFEFWTISLIILFVVILNSFIGSSSTSFSSLFSLSSFISSLLVSFLTSVYSIGFTGVLKFFLCTFFLLDFFTFLAFSAPNKLKSLFWTFSKLFNLSINFVFIFSFSV